AVAGLEDHRIAGRLAVRPALQKLARFLVRPGLGLQCGGANFIGMTHEVTPSSRRPCTLPAASLDHAQLAPLRHQPIDEGRGELCEMRPKLVVGNDLSAKLDLAV